MANRSPSTHRVALGVADARVLLADLHDAPVWSMTTADAAETVVELARLEAQVAALKLQVLAQADATGVAADAGASSTANWYAANATITRRQAHAEMRLAAALAGHQPTADALAAGELHLDHAQVILRAVDQLPDDITAAQVTEAEEHLVVEAKRFDAKDLARIGNHLVEVVAPEIAEAHTARLLEAEERAGQAETSLHLYEDSEGRHHGRFTLDRLHGAMLKKMLLAIAAPKHQAASGPLGERKPTPERLGHAFAELIETYPADRLPDAGGITATIVVTMPLSSATGGDQPATLDTGETISASQARRLACEAGLIPVVLDGKGLPLDVGRKQRLFTTAQRIALAVRDKGCTADGCDWPPGMCHAHHDTPWSHAGPTDLANGRLLCPYHHARAHDPTYEMRQAPGNRVGFYRRE